MIAVFGQHPDGLCEDDRRLVTSCHAGLSRRLSLQRQADDERAARRHVQGKEKDLVAERHHLRDAGVLAFGKLSQERHAMAALMKLASCRLTDTAWARLLIVR